MPGGREPGAREPEKDADADDNVAVGEGSHAGEGSDSDSNVAIGDDAEAGEGDDANDNIAIGVDSDAGAGVFATIFPCISRICTRLRVP